MPVTVMLNTKKTPHLVMGGVLRGSVIKCSDHFGPRHCAIGAKLSPVAHENMTYGPKWPVKILIDAKFYHDCVEIKTSSFSIRYKHAARNLPG